MFKKIIIAAGGTGGHLFPAMGMAQQLLKEDPSLDLLFVAGGLSGNLFFDRNSFRYSSISSATFSKKSIGAIFNSCRQIVGGFFESRKILSDFSPDLVVGFGSYHAFPILLAAKMRGYPIVLHEQNSKPGKVIRFFSKKALMTGVYFPSSMASLKGNTIQLSMPLREGYRLGAISREESIDYFNLDSSKTTLLIFGGSQGAQFINQAIPEILTSLSIAKDSIQVLHFTGNSNQENEIQKTYQKASIKAIVKSFEERMDMAWTAADLMVGRAGAGSIAEQVEFEVPSILIPYPYASENHQDSNADFMVNDVKGGWKFQENEFKSAGFKMLLEQLLQKDNALLAEKKEHLALYKKEACPQEFTSIIRQLLGEQ